MESSLNTDWLKNARLLHAQKDIECIFPDSHPSIDEISAEIPSEQKNREAADRGVLCREVGDDVTTEYGPDRLDA